VVGNSIDLVLQSLDCGAGLLLPERYSGSQPVPPMWIVDREQPNQVRDSTLFMGLHTCAQEKSSDDHGSI
jgi:hypothetical protein